MQVNRSLLWDCPPGTEARTDDAFVRFYITRVLTSGTISDVRSLGLETIREHLSRLTLPPRIRAFWEFVFARLSTKTDDGRSHAPPATAP